MLDRARGRTLALKLLARADASALQSLKREFRALVDLRGEHLVKYHELGEFEGSWYFTMDVVHGQDFLRWVRGGATRGTMDTWADAGPQPESGGVACDIGRLRRAADGLTRALAELHGLGIVHRDVKPSNVLLDGNGHVVLLDFGIATPARGGTLSISGTPAYMAPEALTPPVGPAGDWYALGVMIWEALTGRLPFEGEGLASIRARASQPPPPPSSVVHGVPADLDELCVRLLHPDPAARPTDAELLGRVGEAARPRKVYTLPVVGREEEIGVCLQARRAAREGRPRIVRIHAPSGAGKTTLLHAFRARTLAEEPDAVVLVGRCHPQELLPHRALDAAIDDLAHQLAEMPATRAATLLPREAHALARMFPVLDRVPSFREAPSRERGEVRERGTAALGELFARIADRWPLCLLVDDAQWGDADSGRLLRKLLADQAPPMLIVVACRSDEPPGPFLTELDRADAEREEIGLDPLDADATVLCATQLAGQLGIDLSDETLRRVHAETRGSPFFIEQYVTSVHEGGEAPGLGVDDLLRRRAARQSEAGQALLERLALSPKGLPLALVETLVPEASGAVEALCGVRLARSVGEPRWVSLWHARVREALAAAIPPDRAAALHLELAAAIRGTGAAEPERVGRHLLLGGRPAESSGPLLEAAVTAEALQGYADAADLYRLAITGGGLERADRGRARQGLARCLAANGERQAAAEALEAALPDLAPEEVAEHRLVIAEYLTRVGRYDEGVARFQAMARELSVRWPGSDLTATLHLLLLRLLGGRRSARPGDEQRVALGRTISRSVRYTNPLLSGWFEGLAQVTARSLTSGADRVAVLADQMRGVGSSGVLDAESDTRFTSLLAECEGRAPDRTVAHAWLTLATTSLLTGRWSLARRCCLAHADAALALGEQWGTSLDDVVQIYVPATINLGLVEDADRARRRALDRALTRGEGFSVAVLRSASFAALRLVRGEDFAAVEADLDEAGRALPRGPDFVEVGYLGLPRVNLLLARGEGEAALALVDSWRIRRRPMFYVIHLLRMDLLFAELRCLALACRARPALLPRLRRAARRLRKEKGWSEAHGHLAEALLANVEGRDARPHLHAAVTGYERAEMSLLVATAASALGEEGDGQSRARAEAWARGEGVALERLRAVYAPGWVRRADDHPRA